MIDLLSKEIRNLFPPERVFDLEKENYIIHCSPSFLEEFKKDILRIGFVIPADVRYNREKPTEIVKFQTPMIGRITFVPDMEQGYKIEKI